LLGEIVERGSILYPWNRSGPSTAPCAFIRSRSLPPFHLGPEKHQPESPQEQTTSSNVLYPPRLFRLLSGKLKTNLEPPTATEDLSDKSNRNESTESVGVVRRVNVSVKFAFGEGVRVPIRRWSSNKRRRIYRDVPL
jgi:hypothetical protein